MKMSSLDVVCHHKMLNLFERWVGESQVNIRVRTIGASSKIAVDLTVISPQVTYGPPDSELRKIAINAAVCTGVMSADYSLLRYTKLTKNETTVRELSFAFQGV